MIATNHKTKKNQIYAYRRSTTFDSSAIMSLRQNVIKI